jgi:site-specific DNA-methyltransferase (adenine-specific)
MFSFVGETVLDPFGGSGTTSLAAKNLDRNSISYEINREFIPVMEEKLGVNQTDIEGTTYHFITQSPFVADYAKEIQDQPYIFLDPHKFDKKTDVKKLQFGSRIDKNSSAKKEDFFTVREVVSAEKLILNNGLQIKLLGVKENADISRQAIKYLVEKTKGKRVFIKYDSVKYDTDNNLLCYLYLANKTFINAHIIKNGLAAVDTEFDFRYKQKFITAYNANSAAYEAQQKISKNVL